MVVPQLSGSDAPEYYEQIVAWLDAEPSVRFAFQPGTFQIARGAEAMGGLYRRATLLICNREEAVEIGGGDHGRVDDLLDSLHRLGPEIVVVTDGPEGAYASDGSQRYRVPAYPDPSPPKERTGAGDAFWSALVAAMVKGLSLEAALALGSRQRHERGPRGRLPIRAAKREPAAHVPGECPGVVRGDDLVKAPPVLAADVGGTQMRAALVDRHGAVLLRRSAATPDHADVPAALIDLVRSVGAERRSRHCVARGRGPAGRR